jgi:hypothetical protein
MAEGGQDFDEALRQQINKRVDEILNPEHRQALLMTYFKDGVADLPELEPERLDDPKVAIWLKDAIFKYIKYQIPYQKTADISDGSIMDIRMRHMTKLLICYYLTKNNVNEDIKNYDYPSKDEVINIIKHLDMGKPYLLEKMPFTIGLGKPRSITHQYRYNYAQRRALEHNSKQKFKGGVTPSFGTFGANRIPLVPISQQEKKNLEDIRAEQHKQGSIQYNNILKQGNMG